MELCYVSGPYRADNRAGVELNISRARRVAVVLWEMGYSVICPHLNTYHFEDDCRLQPQDYITGDLEMVARCDSIVMLEGWRASSGAVQEWAHATSLGKKVYEWPMVPTMHNSYRWRGPTDRVPTWAEIILPAGDNATVPGAQNEMAPVIQSEQEEARDGIETLACGAKQSHVEERYELLPELGLRQAALAAGLGAQRYGDNNWRKGIPVKSHVNHCIRHLYEWLSGDRSEDHLGHAAWRALAAAHTEQGKRDK